MHRVPSTDLIRQYRRDNFRAIQGKIMDWLVTILELIPHWQRGDLNAILTLLAGVFFAGMDQHFGSHPLKTGDMILGQYMFKITTRGRGFFSPFQNTAH
jgi:hypothetical protein